MRNLFRILAVGSIAALIALGCTGCGTASKSSGGPNPTTSSIVTGQWEFNFNNSTYFVEVNLTDNGSGVASGSGAVALEQKFFSSSSGGVCGLPSQNAIGGGNSTNEFTGFLDVGENEDDTLAGILAANYASISEGTVSGGNVLCGQAVPLTTFTAYVVPPINGTFTGTLNSSEGYQDQVSVQISENTSQQVTLTGTVTGNGVSTTVAVPSSNPAQMVGALINGGGTATNAQGTDSFHIAARYGAAASQIYINISISNGENLTGYLSQQ